MVEKIEEQRIEKNKKKQITPYIGRPSDVHKIPKLKSLVLT